MVSMLYKTLPQKPDDEFIFYLRKSQLCKAVQYAYQFKNLLRLKMHRQSGSKEAGYEELAIAVHVLQNTQNLVNSH